MQDKCQR